jgi:hypothetical protein
MFEVMMKRPEQIPPGFHLEYEYRPSMGSIIYDHQIPQSWKYTPEELNAIKEEMLRKKHSQYARRKAWECTWQQFTYTGPSGNPIMLRMTGDGRVFQVRKVVRPVEFLEEV